MKCDPNCIKIVVLQKNFENCPKLVALLPQPPQLPEAGGSVPRPRLWYAWVTLVRSSVLFHLDIFCNEYFDFQFKLAPFRAILAEHLPRPKFWSSNSTASLFNKMSFFLICDDVIACDFRLPFPQLKILAAPMLPENRYVKRVNV